jgi:hypothetical protein
MGEPAATGGVCWPRLNPNPAPPSVGSIGPKSSRSSTEDRVSALDRQSCAYRALDPTTSALGIDAGNGDGIVAHFDVLPGDEDQLAV